MVPAHSNEALTVKFHDGRPVNVFKITKYTYTNDSVRIDWLNSEINAGLADPTIKERLADLGGAPIPMTPAEFGKLIATETEKWAKVIRAANIKVE